MKIGIITPNGNQINNNTCSRMSGLVGKSLKDNPEISVLFETQMGYNPLPIQDKTKDGQSCDIEEEESPYDKELKCHVRACYSRGQKEERK